MSIKVQIVPGAMVSQDFHVALWPECPQNQDPPNQDLVFDAVWKGSFWQCTRSGFGDTPGAVGGGALFVHDKDGVIMCIEDDRQLEHRKL